MEHPDIFSALIWPYTNFFIFLFILYKFGRKPLSDLAIKKQADFDTLAAAAETAQADAKKREEELDARLKGLQSETNSILEKAEREAKALTARVVLDAQKVAKQLIEESQRQGEQELRSAQERLHLEVERALAKAFQNKIKSNFSSENHSQFINRGLAVFDKHSQSIEKGSL